MYLAKKKRTLELHVIKGKAQSSTVSDTKLHMYIHEDENKLIL